MIKNVAIFVLSILVLVLSYTNIALSKELRKINTISWKWENMYTDLSYKCGVH